MAKSGTIYGSSAGNGNYLYIEWSESNVSTANNTSTVTATVKLYNGYGSHSNGDPTWVTLYIDGTKYEATLNYWSGSPVTLISKSKTVTHATNGSKSCSISATFDTNGTSTGVVSASGTVTLTSIPRYATSNQSVAEKTDTTIKMNWSSDSYCDMVWVSIDNGSSWIGYVWSGNAKSGSYTITGLSPKTKYNIKTRVRRKDSQLTTDSSVLAVTTYGANYFTLALENLTADGSLTSAKIKATTTNTEENNASKIYSLLWEYYPSGNSAMKTTITSNNCLPDNGSVNQVFSKLLTGTIYNITAKLYKGTVSGGTLVKTQTITAQTAPYGGTLKITARSSSAIHVMLTNLPSLEYATRVDFSYKRREDTAWTVNNSVNIASGANGDIDSLYTGLTQMTAYDIKAQVYMVDGSKSTLLKTFDISTSTLAYVAGLETMIPFIRSSIIVPRVGKGYLVTGLSDALPSGFTIHAYLSTDGEQYIDLGDIGDDMAVQISGAINSSAYYKLALVDRNDNAYNETEPVEISFPDLSWAVRTAGQVFDVTSNDMKTMASALISLYKYLAVEGDVTEYTDTYTELVAKMGTLSSGVVVEGGEGSGFLLIGYLASLIIGDDPMEPREPETPITASVFNALYNTVCSALDTIAD